MSRTILKIAAYFLAVVLLAAGMLAVALPRLVNQADFQATLHGAATQFLGAPVAWQHIEWDFLPPRLTVHRPTLTTAVENSNDARLAAESIELDLALLPIFFGRIEINSLTLRGVEAVLTRTPDGVLLPSVPALFGVEGGIGAAVQDTGSDRNSAPPIGIALRQIVVREGRIVLRDQTRSPAIEWSLDEIELEARASLIARSLVLEMGAKLQSNQRELGQLAVAGTIHSNGAYALEVDVEEWRVGVFWPTLAGGDSTVFDLVAEAQLGLESDGQGPVQIDAKLQLSDGGRLAVEGTAILDGQFDLLAKIESLDLGNMQKFLPDPSLEMGGLASGTARLVGRPSFVDFVELDVHVESGSLRVPNVLVKGPFDAAVKIEAPLSLRPSGRIDVDLTAASVDYYGQFTKRAGLRAKMTTTFSTGASGERQFESQIKFRDVNEILLRGELGEIRSIALTTPTINLSGWSELFPALAGMALGGSLSFDAVGFESSTEFPTRIKGRIALLNPTLEIPDVGQIGLAGIVHAADSRLSTQGLRLTVAGVTLGIEGTLEEPFDSGRFEFAIESIGESEANDFFSALSSASDVIFGDLQIRGHLRGALRGDLDLFSNLKGALQVSIGERGGGRLRGVPILKAMLKEIPFFGGRAKWAQRGEQGSSVGDYFTEDFEFITGDFEIADGVVYASPLRLVYEGYEAYLTGPIQIPDLEIEMTGEVLLKANLISALGDLLGVRIANGESVRIPLAEVTNTLDDPRIVLTPKTLVAIPRLLFRATGIDVLSHGLRKALGSVLRGVNKR
ncbi:MAG: AsmA-like C-terminal region-containing protein [Myxococcota bacterium]